MSGVMRESGLSNEMTMLMARIAMSSSQRENVNIAGEFGQLIERVIELEGKHAPGEKETAITGTIKFTKDECKGMDIAFKKAFSGGGYVARVIKRRSGKKGFLYEIRYRRNGYNLSASSKDINEAKKKFIELTKTQNIGASCIGSVKSGMNLFREIAQEWLTYKKGQVCERTLKGYESYCKRYLLPVLGEKPIKNIRTAQINEVLTGKGERLYEDLRTVFNAIFTYAVKSGVIVHNPVSIIPFKRAERTNGRALTAAEQRKLFERLELPEFAEHKRIFLTMYYFGLRPFELTDAHFEGDFLIARNAKRKGGKVEYKKIPIPDQARVKMDVETPIETTRGTEVYNRIFKRIMGDDSVKQYYLRHTFATTAQQYVRPDVVDMWLGDSPNRLVGRVYTHFPDAFMREQMGKVMFEV